MPKFVYRSHPLDRFQALTIEAFHGDPEPLCDYLINGSQPITRKDAKHLAWLLDRRLPRRRGRPRRSLSSKNCAVECASYLVRLGKREWCRRHGTKKATKKTPVDRLIRRAIELVEPHFPGLRSKIREHEVCDFKLKPHPDVVAHVEDVFPEAKREIIKEALA